MINAGSSSIKFAVFSIDSILKKIWYGSIQNINTVPYLRISGADGSVFEKEYSESHEYQYYFELLLARIASSNNQVIAIGHRVVHGGRQFLSPIIVTPTLIADLKELIPFAPLHQPYNVQAIEIFQHTYPNMLQVACFDTAFHHTHPPVADRFGLPRSYMQAGIRRYGFHGLSYEYIMYKLSETFPNWNHKRIVIAHLGNGASLCAVKNGQSIDSTMGFTALDGLVMGTRCGNIDPGVILYLMKSKQMSYDEIEDLLYKKSGLLGISEISSNMQTLLSCTDKKAQEAIDLFVYRIRRELGALVSVLGGLDLLVFTGGIGEHAYPIREAVCQNMEWLNLALDAEANTKNNNIISQSNSQVEIMVIPTDEEWIIANHTYHLMEKKHGN